jgi:hypothetical protein
VHQPCQIGPVVDNYEARRSGVSFKAHRLPGRQGDGKGCKWRQCLKGT